MILTVVSPSMTNDARVPCVWSLDNGSSVVPHSGFKMRWSSRIKLLIVNGE